MGNFDVCCLCADEQVQTVGAHAFDDQTCNTVEDAVESGAPTKLVVFGTCENEHANQKSNEGASTFVKESCLVPAGVRFDPNGIAIELGEQSVCSVWQCIVHVGNQVTVGLLVEEVAPTAERLRQKYAWDNAIGNDAEILLADFCHHHGCEEADDNATVDTEATATEIEKCGPIGDCAITPREDVDVGTCAKYAQRNDCKGVDCYVVRVVAAFFEVQTSYQDCQAHTCYDAKCVEVDFETENVQGGTRLIEIEAEIFVTEQKFRKK